MSNNEYVTMILTALISFIEPYLNLNLNVF